MHKSKTLLCTNNEREGDNITGFCSTYTILIFPFSDCCSANTPQFQNFLFALLNKSALQQ